MPLIRIDLPQGVTDEKKAVIQNEIQRLNRTKIALKHN